MVEGDQFPSRRLGEHRPRLDADEHPSEIVPTSELGAPHRGIAVEHPFGHGAQVEGGRAQTPVLGPPEVPLGITRENR